MTQFQIFFLVIMGVVGLMLVLVLYQMWKTLRTVERLLTEEVARVAEEIRLAIDDARKTIQEATRLVSSVEQNVGHMNSTFLKMGDTILHVAEMFQAPWMKAVGFVNQAVNFFKGWKGGDSASRKSGKKR